MKIVDVAKLTVEEGKEPEVYQIIKALKKRSFTETPLKDILKEINIDLHDIMNPALRPDKKIYKPRKATKGKPYAGNIKSETTDDEGELVRIEKTNRICLSFQELICNKRVSFCLANPAKREYKGLKKKEVNPLFDDLEYANERIMFDNKIATHDREVARNIFTYTEVAEYAYLKESETATDHYGFPSKYKIKYSLFTRENGEKFYPIKNDLGDMICFAREYKQMEKGRQITYLQAFTDEEIGIYKQTGAYNWTQISKVPHDLEKIPIVFGWQRFPEYRSASTAIARLEVILSNHAEVNDYHAAPKILLTHAENITGFGEKGSSSMVIQAKGEAEMKYVTWEHSTDSVKAEIDRLLEMIYTLTQTPNINFDNLKGMGAVSGVSIKLLFLDAHLAVKDKEGVLLDFFQRRNSINLAYLKKIEPKFAPIVDRVEINSYLDPFMIADDKENAEIAQIENGGLATKSQKTTVMQAGGDAEEYEQILKEEKDRKIVDITEPTI